GYKLGGGAKTTPVAHVVKNSMAFNNAAGGFVDNTQPGKMVISRNTAWNNIAGAGFDFADSTPTISGNIAVLNKVNSQLKGGTASGNSWQSGSWSNSSFASLDSSALTGPRAANGLVRASTFLIPKSGAAIGARYV
ncbi:unnamed protein product, partial [Rhizoctonia solani]